MDFGNFVLVQLYDGSDTIHGDYGDDDIYGDNVISSLCIESIGDDDFIYGEEGNDTMDGQLRSDTFYFDPAPTDAEEIDTITELEDVETDERIDEGIYDRLDFSALPEDEPATVDLSGGLGGFVIAQHSAGGIWHYVEVDDAAYFENIEQVVGGSGDDLIAGNVAENWFDGGPGNDAMAGGDGDDIYYFATAVLDSDANPEEDTVSEEVDQGSDTFDFSALEAGDDLVADLTVDFPGAIATHLNRTVTTVAAGQYAYFENVIGGAGDDQITANSSDNTLTGGAGDDQYFFNNGFGIENYVVEAADEGDDTLDFSAVTVELTFTIASVTVTDGVNTAIHEDDNIEHLIGGQADDTFTFSTDGGQLAGGNGTIDGQAGNDTLDYSGYTTEEVEINPSAGTASSGVSQFFSIEIFSASSTASDTLVGPDLANTWNIIGTNEGNLTNTAGVFNFAGIENLTGGSNTDDFVFSHLAGVDGTINGGDDVNTFDYSAYTEPIAVDLGAETASGTGGFVEIQEFTGGSTNDMFTAPDDANTWNITADNSGDISGVAIFADFENLTGGTADDVFVFTEGVMIDGEINGGASSDTLDYNAFIGAIAVDLANGTAMSTGSIASIESVVGGINVDTITGPNSSNTWNITASNKGNIAGIGSFTDVENLTGGTNNDAFVFDDGAAVAGIIDGNGGVNRLDFSAYVASVGVDLHGGIATGTAGITDIDSVVGGMNSDTLRAADVVNIWKITGDNEGVIIGIVNFTDFENLIGGTNSDAFDFFASGILDGRITGGGGVDTLTAAAGANTWNITDNDKGELVGVTLFEEIANLTGGGGDDEFVFSDGFAISGEIKGNLGSDTLDYSAYTSFVTIDLVSRIANATTTFAGIKSFIGGTLDDEFGGPDLPNIWDLTGNNIGVLNGTVSFSSFANLTGATLSDVFDFTDGASVNGIIDGGNGVDTLDYFDYTTPVNVDLGVGSADGTGGVANIEAIVFPP
jgi:Ca2+-binding RTX toxin-like protein